MARGTIYLKSRLTRSGFSNERVFRVEQSDGQECVGAAPVHYCWTEMGHKLEDNMPTREKPLEGLVAGRLLFQGNDSMKVELPDGQLIEVHSSQLSTIHVEQYAHVPV